MINVEQHTAADSGWKFWHQFVVIQAWLTGRRYEGHLCFRSACVFAGYVKEVCWSVAVKQFTKPRAKQRLLAKTAYAKSTFQTTKQEAHRTIMIFHWLYLFTVTIVYYRH